MSGSASRPKSKGFALDPLKIKKAQRVLGTTNERETLERALDEIVAEDRRNKLAWKAHERFLRSGVHVDDVYGNLES